MMPSNGARMFESPEQLERRLLLRLRRPRRTTAATVHCDVCRSYSACEMAPVSSRCFTRSQSRRASSSWLCGDLRLRLGGRGGERRRPRVDHGDDLALLHGLTALDERRRRPCRSRRPRCRSTALARSVPGQREELGHRLLDDRRGLTCTGAAASRGGVAAAASSDLWQAAKAEKRRGEERERAHAEGTRRHRRHAASSAVRFPMSQKAAGVATRCASRISAGSWPRRP